MGDDDPREPANGVGDDNREASLAVSVTTNPPETSPTVSAKTSVAEDIRSRRFQPEPQIL